MDVDTYYGPRESAPPLLLEWGLPPAPCPLDTPALHVLLVEDNPVDAFLLQETLTDTRHTAFEVTVVERLSQALQRLAEERFDVVLLDLSLPDSQGLDTFSTLHAQAQDMPIVVLTGFDDERCVVAALHGGAQDYLVKGQIEGNLLLRAIRYAIERQRAEETMKRLKGRHQRILHALGEGVLGLDLQGQVIFVNPAAANLTGYTIAELLGRPVCEALHPMQADGTRYAWETSPVYVACKHGAVHRVTGEIFWRKDGTRFPVEYVSTPICERGEVVGAVMIFQDITERQAVERMKDEFTSVVSHELRTPLSAIRGALGLLAGGLLGTISGQGQRLLEIAVTNTERLARLITDILDIERLESGHVTVAHTACAASDLMAQAVDMVQTLATKADVTLSVAPVSARLWVDPDRIVQILTNLLSNAIKFSPVGATVWLRAEPVGAQMMFQVQDQGRGIPADKLQVIFERFRQVDASDARDKGGTGLGLAICRSLVQQHGGRIWVESTLGAGSTFCCTLPLLPEVAATAASVRAYVAPAFGSG